VDILAPDPTGLIIRIIVPTTPVYCEVRYLRQQHYMGYSHIISIFLSILFPTLLIYFVLPWTSTASRRFVIDALLRSGGVMSKSQTAVRGSPARAIRRRVTYEAVISKRGHLVERRVVCGKQLSRFERGWETARGHREAVKGRGARRGS